MTKTLSNFAQAANTRPPGPAQSADTGPDVGIRTVRRPPARSNPTTNASFSPPAYISPVASLQAMHPGRPAPTSVSGSQMVLSNSWALTADSMQHTANSTDANFM